ncbi:unnamed protein product, partial [Mesorhabditis belari]|uniref:G-protein coupled receptors family 1 profile domain-containing protein n=1 Tax=Mesorhabditis belari TaxID=2138241 RepID=A0AAF3JBQ9_9BILA
MSAKPDNDSLRQLIVFHTVNISLGLVCSVLATTLIFIFITSTRMLNRNRLLFTLSLADFCNCLAITLMGVDRVTLYEDLLDGGSASSKRAGECAAELWLFFRTIGDLWPPIVQTMIGFECLLKACQGKNPINRSRQFQIFTVLFVIWASSLGYAVAYGRRNEKAKYFCGRKAAFGRAFSVFIYAHNVFGYIAGLVLNVTAYRIASIDSNSHRINPSVIRQMRVCIMVSLLSTVLVSIPNSLSLISAVHLSSISNAITKPAVYATCINSGINIFVYFVLNSDFRRRCIFLLTREEFSSNELYMDADEEEDKEWIEQQSNINPTISHQKLIE